MKNKKYMLFSGLLLSLMVSSSYAGSDVVYRYKDASGKTVYSDDIPANIKGQVDILSSKTGVLQKVIKKELTQEEYEELNKKVDEEKSTAKQSVEQMRKDQTLLNTYSSVKDIEAMKKYEVEQLDRAMQTDISNQATLTDRKNAIERDIEKNPKLASSYAESLKKLENDLEVSNKNLDKNKEMLKQRQDKYDSDKKRYTELLKELGQSSEKSK